MSQDIQQDRLLRIETRLAAIDFYQAYANTLDSECYDDWPDFFAEDGLYRILSRENHELGLPVAIFHCESRAMMRDRVTAIKETMLIRPRGLRHILSGIRVLEDQGDSLRGQADVLLVESLRDELTKIVLSARYYDKFIRREGRLLLQERICVYDSTLLPTSLVAPV